MTSPIGQQLAPAHTLVWGYYCQVGNKLVLDFLTWHEIGFRHDKPSFLLGANRSHDQLDNLVAEQPQNVSFGNSRGDQLAMLLSFFH
jgi:hypothetical protein